MRTGDALHGRRSPAFSLIELLIVLAVLAVLATITIPVVGNVRRNAMSLQTLSNLRQWGIAINIYTNDNDGRLPGPTFQNIDKWVNYNRVAQAQDSDVSVRRQTLFSYLYPYVREDWENIRGRAQHDVEIGECPVTKTAGAVNPVQHFMRTRVAGSNMEDPFGYPSNDPSSVTLPLTLAYLQENHRRGLDRIPAISNLDLQNSNAGSSDGASPRKAVHRSRRAYLFFDGHTELLDVSDNAHPGTQIVEGYGN